MKFRAKLVDINCIGQFLKIFTTVGKIAKLSTLRLSETQVVLTHNERAASGGTAMWCEVNQADFFDEYRIEGKDESNEIYLEVINENIVRALKSGQRAQSIKIKLTKKATACLTFEITLPSMTMHTRSVSHDVPVAVIPSRFWEDFQKPQLPNYDVRITVPELRILKNVVERMKNISGYIVVSASRDGEIRFKVETDEVSATTHFKNMEVHDGSQGSNQSSEDPLGPDRSNISDAIEVRIDIQKLVMFLNVQLLNPTRIWCGIVHGQAVHMFMQCNEILFQYFMPGMNVSIG